MKRMFAKLAAAAGLTLNIIAGMVASTYLFAGVIWMHAPLLPALLVTLVLVIPLLVLGWILRRAGRPPSPGPWYRIGQDGKLARQARVHD